MTVILRAFSRAPSPKTPAIIVDLGWRTIERWGTVAQLGPRRFQVVSMILCAQGPVSLRELGDALCADREDGGPDDPRAVAATHIWRARSAMAPLGVVLRAERQGWYEAQILYSPARPVDIERGMTRPANSRIGKARRKAEAEQWAS